MSTAPAQAGHAVRSGVIDRQLAFAPALGMLAGSMLPAGEGLLGHES